VYFSRPLEDEYSELLRVAAVARHESLRPPYDCVVDASGLDDLSPAAFEALLAHVDAMQAYGPLVRKVGCVRPRGMLGAALSGVFYEAVRTRFSAALFERRAEAFAWLGRDDAANVAAEIDARVDDARQTPALLRRLRERMHDKGRALDLAHASHALGVTKRTLQRSLQDAGTTFRDEAERARIAVAERMLLDESVKIDLVAQRAGFASASHLARSFRRHTGETPADFRRRRRAG
jgi:AraC-like DNA-binding protein